MKIESILIPIFLTFYPFNYSQKSYAFDLDTIKKQEELNYTNELQKCHNYAINSQYSDKGDVVIYWRNKRIYMLNRGYQTKGWGQCYFTSPYPIKEIIRENHSLTNGFKLGRKYEHCRERIDFCAQYQFKKVGTGINFFYRTTSLNNEWDEVEVLEYFPNEIQKN